MNTFGGSRQLESLVGYVEHTMHKSLNSEQDTEQVTVTRTGLMHVVGGVA